MAQPLRHGCAVPPLLIGEALAWQKAESLRQRLPYVGELSSDSETERLNLQLSPFTFCTNGRALEL